jgi:adenylate cyclase
MTQYEITSAEVLSKTGISRATLYNYVALGILPRPHVKRPEKGHGRAKRLGYFPISTLDVVERVNELKRGGMTMNEIKAALRPSDRSRHKDKDQHSAVPNMAPQDNVVELEEIETQKSATVDDGRPALQPETLSMHQNLGLDSVSGPAYMVNNQFEVEWSNAPANDDLFRLTKGLSEDITECSVFPLLLNQEHIQSAVDRDEILSFHLIAAKNRIPRSRLYSLGALMEGEDIEMLLKTYDEVEAADRATLLHTTVNMAPADSPADWYVIYASFFREGVFFTYEPSVSPSDNLLELLGRRDIVIRELLKRRRPYLTPLAVMVADIQNSVKICAELPPEEYFELINQIWSTMEPILRKYHATHGKHVGDGLLCYFFPQPDSNYILNTLRCAEDMQRAMQAINIEWRARKAWTNELMLNIGVDEGQEWFGTYQTNTHLEFTVLGDTVNRGGRLSDFASGGTTWASKNLVGSLSQSERETICYGVHRVNAEGEKIFVDSTFSRISNLVDLELPQNLKLMDLGSLPVTEIVSVDEAL